VKREYWIAIGAGLGLVALLAILSLVPGPDRTGDSVVVFGDSITEFGEGHLGLELGSTYGLIVDGDFGARVGDRVQPAAQHADADQVIVNLGTNDVVVGTPLDKVRLAMDALLDELSDVECVHVVTVSGNLLSDGVLLPDAGREVNRMIAAAASGRPNVDLLHWDRIQQAAALRRGDPQALTFDGIHPDDDGLRVLAESYDGVLADCGRPWFLP